MPQRPGVAPIALALALMVGCGGHHSRRLGDGDWYGRLVAVNVAHRTLTFAPACRRSEAGRWIAVADRSRAATAVSVSRRADLSIYYRPNGDAARGHGERTDLALLADTAARGRLPDHPPGWFVRVRAGTAVSVEESSGIRSSGKADKRTFACVWSARTQAFVGD